MAGKAKLKSAVLDGEPYYKYEQSEVLFFD